MNLFMKTADLVARQNVFTDHGGPFGAVVVKDGYIVGIGNNRVVQSNDPTAHAEVMAIRDACKNLNTFDLTGCELITSCYPCPMCLSAIIWSNIKKVYFGCRPEDAEKIGFRDDFIYKFIENKSKDKNILDICELDRKECLQLFKEYSEKNKVIY